MLSPHCTNVRHDDIDCLHSDLPREDWCQNCKIADVKTLELKCLEHGPACQGTVEYRMPLSGTGKSFPRCEHHWDKRLDQQAEINRKYGSNVPPADFDPMYAGEHWDEEYW